MSWADSEQRRRAVARHLEEGLFDARLHPRDRMGRWRVSTAGALKRVGAHKDRFMQGESIRPKGLMDMHEPRSTGRPRGILDSTHRDTMGVRREPQRGESLSVASRRRESNIVTKRGKSQHVRIPSYRHGHCKHPGCPFMAINESGYCSRHMDEAGGLTAKNARFGETWARPEMPDYAQGGHPFMSRYKQHLEALRSLDDAAIKDLAKGHNAAYPEAAGEIAKGRGVIAVTYQSDMRSGKTATVTFVPAVELEDGGTAYGAEPMVAPLSYRGVNLSYEKQLRSYFRKMQVPVIITDLNTRDRVEL